MLKKWIIVLLVLVLALGAVGCGRRCPMRQPSEGQTQEEGTQEDQTPGDETEEGAGTPAVNDKVELYSYSYRWPGGHYHGWGSGSDQEESSSDQEESGQTIGAESTAAYLEEGDTFYIDITLIDLEDTVDFIYTVEINGDKYRYSDGVFGNTERDREEKTVTFSVELTYDGETNVYRIDSIIVMSDLSIRYYVTIPEENKPVELPSRAGSGTEEDPYLVYNAEMFLEMSEYPAGTYFRQMNDIDISAVDTGEKVQSGTAAVLDRWKPMGTSAEPFRSHYDGNNFKITRLSIQRMDTKYSGESFGLFGKRCGQRGVLGSGKSLSDGADCRSFVRTGERFVSSRCAESGVGRGHVRGCSCRFARLPCVGRSGLVVPARGAAAVLYGRRAAGYGKPSYNRLARALCGIIK